MKSAGTSARHASRRFCRNRVFLDCAAGESLARAKDADELGLSTRQIGIGDRTWIGKGLGLSPPGGVRWVLSPLRWPSWPDRAIVRADRSSFLRRRRWIPRSREVPHLRALASRGVGADGLILRFVKTFPNHYNDRDGPLPQHHGIVSNVSWIRISELFTMPRGPQDRAVR